MYVYVYLYIFPEPFVAAARVGLVPPPVLTIVPNTPSHSLYYRSSRPGGLPLWVNPRPPSMGSVTPIPESDP